MAVRLPLLVLTSPLPGDALALAEGRARVRTLRPRGPLSEKVLLRALRPAVGAVTLLSHPVSARVLESCPKLKVVSNYAVGTDNVDLEAARRSGIRVTNTPDVLTEATADLAWTLLLGAARRASEGDRMVRAGRFRGWAPGLLLGMDLRGKLLGIVGMGRIGRAVARRAPAFGMRVAYTQRRRLLASEEAALGAAYMDLDALLNAADVVSLHCPLTPDTRHLLGGRRLRSMKPGAVLVNTARGPVVDEEALVECLREGRLLGAGLDVYEGEPALAPGLRDLPNVLLLPHLGSAGEETRAEMARMAVADCLAVVEGREPAHPVV
ncbi:MAG: D-glycerate dehydrogenase [Acidobacteriota bacterium]